MDQLKVSTGIGKSLDQNQSFRLLIHESTEYVTKADQPYSHMSIRLHDKCVDLEISYAAVSDSALYYSALQPTVTGKPSTQYKNVSFSFSFPYKMLLLIFIIFSLLKENAGEDIIKSVFKEKQVLAGKDVTLICNYTGNIQNLQWYRQYPGSKPEHLIMFFETIPGSELDLRLTAAADKATKTMNLTIYSTEVKDSAMYYCALQPTYVDAEVTLSCNYSGTVLSLQWYRQYPGSKPENIIFYTESNNQSEPKLRLYGVANKGIKLMNLSIYSMELDDSALYYCALVPTVTRKTTALYKNRQSGHTVTTKQYQHFLLGKMKKEVCVGGAQSFVSYSRRNHGDNTDTPSLRSESGDVIRPDQPSVVLTEESNTTLSCTYDGSAYSLHWYRQKPGSKPEFLLLIAVSSKHVTKADQPHPHMSIRLHDKRVNLEISAAVSDSAMYYCALEPTVTGKPSTQYKNFMLLPVFIVFSLLKENAGEDIIKPAFTEKQVLAGKDVTLICNYTVNVNNLQWYRQYPGSKPEHLISHTESTPNTDQVRRLNAAADKATKSMNLTIYSTEVKDSAMYYCALQPTVTGNTTTLYKNRVRNNTEDENHDAHFKYYYVLNVYVLTGETTGYGIRPEKNISVFMQDTNITISCLFDGSIDSFYWYQQKSGSRPEFLIMIDEASHYVIKANPPYPRVSIKLDKVQKRVHLEISSAAVMDSAIYYCASRPTVTGNICTPYKNPYCIADVAPHIHNIFSPKSPLELINYNVVCFIQRMLVKQVLAGKDVTLICNHTGTVSNLQWYHQFSASKPEHLIMFLETIPKSKPDLRLTAAADKITKTMNLTISSTEVKDSAILLLNTGKANGDVIRPNQPSVVLTEGSNIILSCTYDESAYSLHWYWQKPGSKPEFLLLIDESSKHVTEADQPHPHMSIRLHDKRVDLEISYAAVSDSAMYYCALRPTVTGNTFTQYKNLFFVYCIIMFVGGRSFLTCSVCFPTVFTLAMLLLIFIIFSLLKENVCEDIIKPVFTQKQALAGKDVTLICNYTGTVSNLQWYRQYPGSKPEHLIVHIERTPKSDPTLRLTAAADKATKSMNLTIYSTEVNDSAMYYCALQPTVTGNTTTLYKNRIILTCSTLTTGYGIRPDKNTTVFMEDTNITLSCIYDGSIDNLHWYQQKSGSRPEFLIMIDEASQYVTKANPPYPRVSIKLDKVQKRVHLEISSAAVMDSAIYYCALRPTATGNTCTLYKNPYCM
ncbi:T cell receptor alpha variable 7 [Labeo rohita]|nr:T cell receptor alpha variable 7 [Labeo rohita]